MWGGCPGVGLESEGGLRGGGAEQRREKSCLCHGWGQFLFIYPIYLLPIPWIQVILRGAKGLWLAIVAFPPCSEVSPNTATPKLRGKHGPGLQGSMARSTWPQGRQPGALHVTRKA